MKIVVTLPKYPPAPGGAEKYAEKVAVGLSKAGHNVKVLTSEYEQHHKFKTLPAGYPRRELRDGVIVIRDRSIPVRRYGYFITPAIPARLLLNPPDLVYAVGFNYWPAFASTVVARMVGAKVIIKPTFGPIESPFFKAYRKHIAVIMRRAEAVILDSEYERDLMLKEGPIHGRSLIVPPGVEPEFFENTHSNKVLERHGLKGRRTILSVGRVDKSKRIDVLIRAAVNVIKRFPDAAFFIAGADYGERANLEALASRLGVADKVVFSGFLNHTDLVSVYKEADLLLHPSSFELFGMVLAEAFAAGLPVIGSVAGSVPEVLGDERYGLLVPLGDHERTAEAVIRMLSDGDLRKRLTNEAKRRALEKYRWKTTVGRIEKLCGEVVD